MIVKGEEDFRLILTIFMVAICHTGTLDMAMTTERPYGLLRNV
jgi:hypothetical protein